MKKLILTIFLMIFITFLTYSKIFLLMDGSLIKGELLEKTDTTVTILTEQGESISVTIEKLKGEYNGSYAIWVE